MKFLLDTNFFIIPGKFKVDVFAELKAFGNPELCTIDLVVKELEKIKSKNSRLALELLKKNKVTILKTSGRVTDKEILIMARKGYTVCTQDRALAKQLHEKNIPVITLRQKKYLVKKQDF